MLILQDLARILQDSARPCKINIRFRLGNIGILAYCKNISIFSPLLSSGYLDPQHYPHNQTSLPPQNSEVFTQYNNHSLTFTAPVTPAVEICFPYNVNQRCDCRIQSNYLARAGTLFSLAVERYSNKLRVHLRVFITHRLKLSICLVRPDNSQYWVWTNLMPEKSFEIYSRETDICWYDVGNSANVIKFNVTFPSS